MQIMTIARNLGIVLRIAHAPQGGRIGREDGEQVTSAMPRATFDSHKQEKMKSDLSFLTFSDSLGQ
jgi:hypothetical protein